ncbi:hypothetical protein HAHE_16630 [Haloferula helveola]|uniref:Tetratricopeptide repeat protein n=1 Tax=Haloferula helveola TaxID=490095 RepID=A0ABM7R968_9BACT|nr:hypothetical protein HAHE_16630 [Haloferula helveola]
MSQTTASSGPNLCFRLSCWVLGLVAFIQLLAGGIALAVRFEASREVRVEKEIVTKIVNVAPKPAPAPAQPAEPVVALPPPIEIPVEKPLPPARPLDAPPIADPVVERLVNEAREARISEDMGSAIVKLEEARTKAPNDPNVHYELGMVYETMAAFDPALAEKAAQSYQAVFELGTTGAGALYPLAAQKLRDGIAMPVDMRGKLALGRARIFKDDHFAGGERVVLTIPVNAAPGSEPDPNDFFVQVKFFDKTANGDPVPATPESQNEVEWVSGEFDWLGGEEVLRVTYVLPAPDPSQEHLFGRRKYYGQVVELIYKNELIDSQAWPRHLASMNRTEPEQGMDPLFLDEELPFDGSLLPPLEDEIPLQPALPPFPER